MKLIQSLQKTTVSVQCSVGLVSCELFLLAELFRSKWSCETQNEMKHNCAQSETNVTLIHLNA